jgi:Pregnancy-associated plasma protein-A
MTNAAARRSSTFRATFPHKIPVVVHVLYNANVDDISDEQIASQIDVLNEDFKGTNVDLPNVPDPFKPLVGDPGLEFHLAKVDPTGADTTGITRTRTSAQSFGIDDSMKADATGGKDPWDAERYLNIWVCPIARTVLGYAQFPGGDPVTDGVVITTTAFGRGGSAQGPFDLGRTTTHEVGHYLNLSHIWGESRWPTCTDSDSVDDTPNQFGPNVGKPEFPALSCGNTPHGDMFMNFMDYVDDDTMVMFTNEQVLRMHAALEFMRSKLGTLPDGSPMFVA